MISICLILCEAIFLLVLFSQRRAGKGYFANGEWGDRCTSVSFCIGIFCVCLCGKWKKTFHRKRKFSNLPNWKALTVVLASVTAQGSNDATRTHFWVLCSAFCLVVPYSNKLSTCGWCVPAAVPTLFHSRLSFWWKRSLFPSLIGSSWVPWTSWTNHCTPWGIVVFWLAQACVTCSTAKLNCSFTLSANMREEEDPQRETGSKMDEIKIFQLYHRAVVWEGWNFTRVSAVGITREMGGPRDKLAVVLCG